jgi:Uma2 family endonuclease
VAGVTAETAFRSEERFTQKQFRRWVDQRPRADVSRYELIDGRIVMTPPAGRLHASVGATLARLLGQFVVTHELGTLFDSSAGYDLPSGDTVEPDLSFVSTGRLAAGPQSGPDDFLLVVPNLVVEILSPSTAKRDQTEKKAIYEHNGVDEYWIVDPRRKTVTVWHRARRKYGAARTFSAGRIRSRLLPRLDLTIAELFTSNG